MNPGHFVLHYTFKLLLLLLLCKEDALNVGKFKHEHVNLSTPQAGKHKKAE